MTSWTRLNLNIQDELRRRHPPPGAVVTVARITGTAGAAVNWQWMPFPSLTRSTARGLPRPSMPWAMAVIGPTAAPTVTGVSHWHGQGGSSSYPSPVTQEARRKPEPAQGNDSECWTYGARAGAMPQNAAAAAPQRGRARSREIVTTVRRGLRRRLGTDGLGMLRDARKSGDSTASTRDARAQHMLRVRGPRRRLGVRAAPTPFHGGGGGSAAQAAAPGARAAARCI